MKRALVAIATACSVAPPSPPHVDPDAGGVPLQPPADAPPDAVSVVVTQGGQPVAGAPVYFQGTDSSLVAATVTDGNGTAAATMIPGGFVTVLVRAQHDGERADAVDQLLTFGDVAIGDVLHVDLRASRASTGVAYDTTLSGLVSGAATYAVFSGCSDEPVYLGGTGTGTIALIDCGTSTDLVVVAQDGAGKPIAAAYLANVQLPPGTPPPMTDAAPLPSATLALTATFEPFVATTMTVQGAPATSGLFEGFQAVLLGDGRFVFGSAASSPMAGGSSQISLQRPSFVDPNNPATQQTVDVFDLAPASDGLGEQRVVQWQPSANSYALDASTALLPAYVRLPGFAGGAVAWGEAPGAVAPQLSRVTIDGARPGIPTPHPWTWRVVRARTGAPHLALPTLPFDGRFDYNPQPADAFHVVELTTASLPGGYDGVRAHAFDDLTRAFDPSKPGSLVVETLSIPTL